MVIRIIIQFFRSRFGEQMLDKLADSGPIRRVARLLVQIFQETKSILPPDTTPEKLKDAFLKSDKLQEIARKAKEELQKRSKKF